MASFAGKILPTRWRVSRRRANAGRLVLPLAVVSTFAFGALAFVAYVLWPRWPGAPLTGDAPALPIVVGNVLFNVPPSAIRVPIQRRAGAQERIDLVFLWPSLSPPAGAAKGRAHGLGAQLFVTIATRAETLSPAERLTAIYPRYLVSEPSPAPEGLAIFAFREDSPYKGEDLIFDAAQPDRFLARCARRNNELTPDTCLSERRIGQADITIRFPRAWLDDWRAVATGLERLMAQLRPTNAAN